MKPSRCPLRHIPEESARILLLLCTTCCGCSTSYIVTPTQRGGDYTYNELVSELNEQEADIILKGGSDILGTQIRMNADSLCWTDPASSKPSVVQVNDVQRIARTNHLVGALEGLGFGVLGAVIAFAANAGAGVDDPGFGVKIIGTLALPPLGLIVGAIAGHSYEYSFPIDSTDAKNK